MNATVMKWMRYYWLKISGIIGFFGSVIIQKATFRYVDVDWHLLCFKDMLDGSIFFKHEIRYPHSLALQVKPTIQSAVSLLPSRSHLFLL